MDSVIEKDIYRMTTSKELLSKVKEQPLNRNFAEMKPMLHLRAFIRYFATQKVSFDFLGHLGCSICCVTLLKSAPPLNFLVTTLDGSGAESEKC